jgi:hypothetical protein
VLTRQQAYRHSFEEKLKKFKESSASLYSKCKEDITKAYACATNSLSCVSSLEKKESGTQGYESLCRSRTDGWSLPGVMSV